VGGSAANAFLVQCIYSPVRVWRLKMFSPGGEATTPPPLNFLAGFERPLRGGGRRGERGVREGK